MSKEFTLDVDDALVIDTGRFDSTTLIEARCLSAPEISRGALRTALSYLYLMNGPINLPRDRLKVARNLLDRAEQVVINWLYTRTNGSLRRQYGAKALVAARNARYRCERCGFPDVRCLNIDHVEGRSDEAHFACLCANCHVIKSREADWGG